MTSTLPTRLVIAVAAALAVLALAGGATARADGIAYHTFFQDPPGVPAGDHSLEQHAIDLIHATPSGERIRFAFRDYNSVPVTDALLDAVSRGVDVEGVIDGDEWTQQQVQRLWAILGPEHLTVCGWPTFAFHSCIANTMAPSLMHNKFLTFSRLDDGRQDVVLETSENFFGPSQFNYFNDMVEIDGDSPLYGFYQDYFTALRAQVRTDDFYKIGPAGPNTAYLSPRAQPDLNTNDTIVDRLNEVDCSEGGSPDGRGLIRVAQMAFRTERAVIMRKLVDLQRAGCDVEVIVSNADGDIIAGLVSAGVRVYPLFVHAIGSGASTSRSEIRVHDKFFLVDAKSTVTGARQRITYAGTSNWRLDEQYSDDLLLRMLDPGVYDAYNAYWEHMRSRADSDQNRPRAETTPPSSAATPTPAANGAGWNDSDVTVRVAASDGHNVSDIGLGDLYVQMAGAQTGSEDFSGEDHGYTVHELPITAEGDTVVTYWAKDRFDNLEQRHTLTVRIDKTAPEISGLPRDCTLWPPDHNMVHVADVTASDPGSGSGLASLDVSAHSNADDDGNDVAIDGGSVDLRAEKADRGATRTYVITATATDVAGNTSTASTTCVVPHSQGAGDK